MLTFLNRVDLHGIEIIIVASKSSGVVISESIYLSIPKILLFDDNKIAFHIVNNYFKKFLQKNAKFLIGRLETIIDSRGIEHSENAKDIIVGIIESYFKKYYMEHEFDIICDIEREKSSCYPNTCFDDSLKVI